MTVGALVDRNALRAVLGRFATGVVVVTARSSAGDPVGMTMNSFTSVSLEPPLVLFCVSRSSRLHRPLTSADVFAVNVLGDAQKAVSRRFARQGFDRFAGMAHATGFGGVPVLAQALGVVQCSTVRVVEAGDHDIVLGRVEVVDAPVEAPSDPLVYYAGAYRTLDSTYADWWTAFG